MYLCVLPVVAVVECIGCLSHKVVRLLDENLAHVAIGDAAVGAA
jgi:hypothetical protein